MSAIAGVYHRDGKVARPESLAGISSRLAWCGPDGEQFAARGPVAMAYRPFDTNRRSRSVGLPPIGSDGTVIAFDGRLDNREEVQRALPTTAADDVQLVLAAYLQGGLQGLAMCVGDFALALWDAAERTLVLCCDGMGRRPLFYNVTGRTVLWASSPRALVEGAGLSLALDEEHLADFLANVSSMSSPFRCVTRLPGGHALVVGPERFEVVRYWSFDPNRTIRYRDDRDYEAHLSEVFQTAIACRLAVDGPAFSELSGGLDSGAVTCVASRLIKRGTVSCPALRTVSYVYDQSPSADERPFIRPVETFLGRSGVHVLESEHPFLTPIARSLRPEWPTNLLWALEQSDRVSEEMRLTGSRVILSGLGGDQVFWSQPNIGLLLSDLLIDRRFGEMLREANRWSRFLKVPLARTVAEAWQYARHREQSGEARVAPWLDATFVARSDLRARMRRLGPTAAAFRLPTAAWQCHAILSASRPYAMEPCSSLGYVDRRYPFLDRRVAEFAIAIPTDQKVRFRESRSILRRGLSGLVPDVVLQRRSKAGPDEALLRALIRHRKGVTTLLRDPLLCAHGLAERRPLQAAVDRACHGEAGDHVMLVRTLSLEFWLRTLEERSSGPEATAPPGWRQQQMQGGTHGPEGWQH
jgi:asparagine synthase (glutamine-hydrolysing)